MPNKNGQGPMNAGSMTGRRRGNCRVRTETGEQAQQLHGQDAGQQDNESCRGPMGCGTGKRAGGGRCGGQGRRSGSR